MAERSLCETGWAGLAIVQEGYCDTGCAVKIPCISRWHFAYSRLSKEVGVYSLNITPLYLVGRHRSLLFKNTFLCCHTLGHEFAFAVL